MRRDLTYEEYELSELAARYGFTTHTDHAAPSGRAIIGPKSGHFDFETGPNEFEGTIAACQAWLAGWAARGAYDRPALVAFDAIKNVLKVPPVEPTDSSSNPVCVACGERLDHFEIYYCECCRERERAR
jgi:hypothetical protein